RVTARLVAGLPRPASLVRRAASLRIRLAEHEGRARDPVVVLVESGAGGARCRARSGSRRLRWNTGTDSRVQSYSCVRADPGCDADAEPGPGDRGIAIV